MGDKKKALTNEEIMAKAKAKEDMAKKFRPYLRILRYTRRGLPVDSPSQS